eukprot:m.896781 g.896781  ORF g.896781 m.896781 type:complete len:1469 (+) comp23668_c0_seq2:177-4583(+)
MSAKKRVHNANRQQKRLKIAGKARNGTPGSYDAPIRDDSCDAAPSGSTSVPSLKNDVTSEIESSDTPLDVRIGYDNISFAERIALAGLVGVDLAAAQRIFEESICKQDPPLESVPDSSSATLKTTIAELKRLSLLGDVIIAIEYGACVSSHVQLNPTAAAEQLLNRGMCTSDVQQQKLTCNGKSTTTNTEGAVPFVVCARGACGPGAIPLGACRVVLTLEAQAGFWGMIDEAETSETVTQQLGEAVDAVVACARDFENDRVAVQDKSSGTKAGCLPALSAALRSAVQSQLYASKFSGCDTPSTVLSRVASTAPQRLHFKASLRERAAKTHWARRPFTDASPRTDPHMYVSGGTALPVSQTPNDGPVVARLRVVASPALRRAMVLRRAAGGAEQHAAGDVCLTPLQRAVVDLVQRSARAGIYQAPLEQLLQRPRDTLKYDLDFLVQHSVLVRVHRALFEDESARAFQRRHAATVFVYKHAMFCTSRESSADLLTRAHVVSVLRDATDHAVPIADLKHIWVGASPRCLSHELTTILSDLEERGVIEKFHGMVDGHKRQCLRLRNVHDATAGAHAATINLDQRHLQHSVPWRSLNAHVYDWLTLRQSVGVRLWELLDAFQIGRTHLHSIMLYLIRNHRVTCSDGTTSDGAWTMESVFRTHDAAGAALVSKRSLVATALPAVEMVAGGVQASREAPCVETPPPDTSTPSSSTKVQLRRRKRVLADFIGRRQAVVLSRTFRRELRALEQREVDPAVVVKEMDKKTMWRLVNGAAANGTLAMHEIARPPVSDAAAEAAPPLHVLTLPHMRADDAIVRRVVDAYVDTKRVMHSRIRNEDVVVSHLACAVPPAKDTPAAVVTDAADSIPDAPASATRARRKKRASDTDTSKRSKPAARASSPHPEDAATAESDARPRQKRRKMVAAAGDDGGRGKRTRSARHPADMPVGAVATAASTAREGSTHFGPVATACTLIRNLLWQLKFVAADDPSASAGGRGDDDARTPRDAPTVPCPPTAASPAPATAAGTEVRTPDAASNTSGSSGPLADVHRAEVALLSTYAADVLDEAVHVLRRLLAVTRCKGRASVAASSFLRRLQLSGQCTRQTRLTPSAAVCRGVEGVLDGMITAPRRVSWTSGPTDVDAIAVLYGVALDRVTTRVAVVDPATAAADEGGHGVARHAAPPDSAGSLAKLMAVMAGGGGAASDDSAAAGDKGSRAFDSEKLLTVTAQRTTSCAALPLFRLAARSASPETAVARPALDDDAADAEHALLTRAMVQQLDAAGVHGLSENALFGQCCVATDTHTPSARQHLCTMFARGLHHLLRTRRAVAVGVEHVALVATKHVPCGITHAVVVAGGGTGGGARAAAGGVPRTWETLFGVTIRPALQLFREVLVRLVHDNPGIPERLVVANLTRVLNAGDIKVLLFEGCEDRTLRMEKRIIAPRSIALGSPQPTVCRELETFYFPGTHAVWHHARAQ